MPDDGDVSHLGNRTEHVLDLAGRDVDPAADDDLLLATDDREVAAARRARRGRPMRTQPSASNVARGALRVGEEPDAGVRAADVDLTLAGGTASPSSSRISISVCRRA